MPEAVTQWVGSPRPSSALTRPPIWGANGSSALSSSGPTGPPSEWVKMAEPTRVGSSPDPRAELSDDGKRPPPRLPHLMGFSRQAFPVPQTQVSTITSGQRLPVLAELVPKPPEGVVRSPPLGRGSQAEGRSKVSVDQRGRCAGGQQRAGERGAGRRGGRQACVRKTLPSTLCRTRCLQSGTEGKRASSDRPGSISPHREPAASWGAWPALVEPRFPWG